MFGILNETKKPKLNPKDLISEYDIYSFIESNHYHLHHCLGSQIRKVGDYAGIQFGFWTPLAKAVSIVGDFNNWNVNSHPLIKVHDSGIWSNWFVFDCSKVHYQYAIHQHNDEIKYINDPFAAQMDCSSRFCSVLVDHKQYKWNDAAWISSRENLEFSQRPINVLSFDFNSLDTSKIYTYQSIAKDLVERAKALHFTHIEIKNFLEELIDFSLQGNDGIKHRENYYFSPSSVFGAVDDFKCFIDYCHKNNIGVIISLPYFNDENFTNINSYKLLEKKQHFNFYLSNTIYWLEEFHIDGFNFADIEFNINNKKLLAIKELFQILTQTIHSRAKGIFTLIENSENLTQITNSALINGLGINLKLRSDIVFDIQNFIINDFASNDCSDLAIACSNIFSENSLLKIDKLNLSETNNDFENLKIITGLFFTLPGKKIINNEFLDDMPEAYFTYLQALAKIYTESKIFFESDFKSSCFEWNSEFSKQYLSFIRWSKDYQDSVIVIANFSDQEILNLRLAVPESGFYLQAFNSDLKQFQGTGLDNDDGVYSSNTAEAGRPYSIVIDLAPKSFLVFKKQ